MTQKPDKTRSQTEKCGDFRILFDSPNSWPNLPMAISKFLRRFETAITVRRHLNLMHLHIERLWSWLNSFQKSETGATAVEVSLMFGLIILAAVVGMGALGQRTNHSFDTTRDQIPSVR